MSNNTLNPPVADRRPHTTTVHGDTRTDDYFYLREKTNPDVLAYLNAENEYADGYMKPTEGLQQKLYDEMLGRIQETDLSVPYPEGAYLYYTRTEEGKQYPIYCRSDETGELVTLDLNALANENGYKFLSVGAYRVSDDGRYLAYTTDTTGFREYTLRIKDLQTGEHLPDVLERVASVYWASDNTTLFYSTEDEAKRPYRVYRHTVGQANHSEDVLVYEERDALFRAGISRTRDGQILFIGSYSFTSTEYHFLRADNPAAPLTLLQAREENHEYYADHAHGLFYIRTNQNAQNFKLVTAPVENPGKANWVELVPHRLETALEDHDCFARHLVLSIREGHLPRLRVRRLDNGDTHDVAFPEPTYTLFGDQNRVFDTDTYRFRYSSFVTPVSVFDYDLNTRQQLLLKETPVLGGYNRAEYVSEWLHAKAEDGTRIPLSVVYRRDTPRDGSAPLLLYAYGSYGISTPAAFNPNRLSLLDRGVIYAIAHIRGGGEGGKPWHDTGKMQVKKNTFTDFIACAEFLVQNKYTSPNKLAIMGGSAGGLLMGAVVNARPELFHTVMSYVPFVDVINTMLDDTLPLTVGEYVEWGNPNEEAAYRTMLSYSPYDNLEAKSYPTMLVKTSLNDSQVMYWEPAKYVAKLRTLKTDTNPLVLKTNMDAGHGGSSGRYDALREAAFDYAFLLKSWGMTD
jgi:oligopeptidase B